VLALMYVLWSPLLYVALDLHVHMQAMPWVLAMCAIQKHHMLCMCLCKHAVGCLSGLPQAERQSLSISGRMYLLAHCKYHQSTHLYMPIGTQIIFKADNLYRC
jgi:hypothetical protein